MKQDDPNTWKQLESAALREFNSGNTRAAIALQKKAVAACPTPDDTDLYKALAFYAASAKDYAVAAIFFQRHMDHHPGDYENRCNLCVLYRETGQYDLCRALAKKSLAEADAHQVDREMIANLHSLVTVACERLGDLPTALKHGRLVFEQRDRESRKAGKGLEPTLRPIPPFNPGDARRNIIAFSLWGSDPRYLDNAVANAELARHIYPEWRCRFYLDSSVPESYLGKLQFAGAELVPMQPARFLNEGLFWRFLVANDPNVDRFLIRDADSMLSVRERTAVNQWLDSDKHFHLMRDLPSHTELILAGMWGGVGGVLPPLEPAWTRFAAEFSVPPKIMDQLFLRQCIWPAIKDHSLTHDSHYDFNGARPFPVHANIQANRHVGQDHSIHTGISFVPPILSHPKSGFKPRKHIIFPLTTGRSGTAFLTQLLKKNAKDAEVHHERLGSTDFNNANPEVRHFMQYNNVGVTPELTRFWGAKLLAVQYGQTETYAEISHFLAKAGLVRFLPLLHQSTVHMICLKRDIFNTAWSLANRFDFANTGFTWLFYLDPAYSRNLYQNPELLKHGMLGKCLWYVLEMRLRTECYKQQYGNLANVIFHDVELEALTKPQGARSFLEELGIPLQGRLRFPGRLNASKHFVLGESEEQRLNDLIGEYEFDAQAKAVEILKGRSG